MTEKITFKSWAKKLLCGQMTDKIASEVKP